MSTEEETEKGCTPAHSAIYWLDNEKGTQRQAHQEANGVQSFDISNEKDEGRIKESGHMKGSDDDIFSINYFKLYALFFET